MNSPDFSSTCPPVPTTSPLDESQLGQIRLAAFSRRAVLSAGRTAKTSGIITLSIGVLAMLFTVVSFSVIGLVASVGVSVIGVVELLGCRRMRRADPSAARMLGVNQLAFLSLIIAYCVLQMATFSTRQAYEAVLSPEARDQLSSLPNMQRSIRDMVGEWAPRLTYGFYGLIIIISVAFQGGMAAYYFTRRKHILAFNAQTPAWIRRLFIELDA